MGHLVIVVILIKIVMHCRCWRDVGWLRGEQVWIILMHYPAFTTGMRGSRNLKM